MAEAVLDRILTLSSPRRISRALVEFGPRHAPFA
jgi:hypothetical protein